MLEREKNTHLRGPKGIFQRKEGGCNGSALFLSNIKDFVVEGLPENFKPIGMKLSLDKFSIALIGDSFVAVVFLSRHNLEQLNLRKQDEPTNLKCVITNDYIPDKPSIKVLQAEWHPLSPKHFGVLYSNHQFS